MVSLQVCGIIINLHPLSLLLLHVFQLHVCLLVILSLPMTFAKCLYKLWKNIIMKIWHVIVAPIRCWHITKHIDDIFFRSFCINLHCKIEYFDMNIWVNIFFEVRVFKSYLIWPYRMAISFIGDFYNYDLWFSISSSWIFSICTFVPSSNYWIHWWSIYNLVHMNNHYQISKHHMGCPKNSNNYCW